MIIKRVYFVYCCCKVAIAKDHLVLKSKVIKPAESIKVSRKKVFFNVFLVLLHRLIRGFNIIRIWYGDFHGVAELKNNDPVVKRPSSNVINLFQALVELILSFCDWVGWTGLISYLTNKEPVLQCENEVVNLFQTFKSF